MDSAEAHEVSQRATGASPLRHLAPLDVARDSTVHAMVGQAVARSVRGAMVEMNDFAQAVAQLVKLLGQLEDAEGRAIWLTAEEVELNQWVSQVTGFRDALADKLK